MSDFFLFSWTEILISLRFISVVVWALTVVFLVLVFVDATITAASYGRVLRGIVGKVVPADYWRFIKHCYCVPNSGITSRWENGSYWNGVGNWGYVSKKSGKWVQKGEQHETKTR